MARNAPIQTATKNRPGLLFVLTELFKHPARAFLECWNWKAAILSMILRAPVYLATTFRYGWHAATVAGCVEAAFSVCAAGVFASFTQAIQDAEPQAMVAFLLLVALPFVALALDALLHYVMRTPNLATGVMASLGVSVVSSAFNWYSMRRGVLLVGATARSFGADLARLPLLIGRFLLEPLLFLWRGAKLLRACMED